MSLALPQFSHEALCASFGSQIEHMMLCLVLHTSSVHYRRLIKYEVLCASFVSAYDHCDALRLCSTLAGVRGYPKRVYCNFASVMSVYASMRVHHSTSIAFHTFERDSMAPKGTTLFVVLSRSQSDLASLGSTKVE